MNILNRARDIGSRSSHIGYSFIVLLLGFPLVTPLLRSSSSPCTHDGHLHYHRIAALRYAWEGGLLASRWLPDVAFGYGYPFFLYREAVPLYATLIPHLLGLPLPAASNLFYALMILAAGLFMFLWVNDLFGPLAGIVSAVVYMAAPYQLIDALIRGNQPESMALALFPLLGWAGRRFIQRGTPGPFLVTTLSLALLALSHNISTLLYVPFLFIYLGAIGWWQRLPWRKLALRLLLVFGIGLALGAFYLVPALLELDEITISQSINRRGNSFRFNFASLAEIFSPVAPTDPNLINPPLLIRLGILPAGLAILGLVCLAWVRSREQKGHIIFMAITAVALLFMSLPISVWLWENLPLVAFVQFPWRFVGRAALPVAFLAGVPVAVLPQLLPNYDRRRYLSLLLTAVIVAAVLLEALPYLYPTMCQEEAWPSITSVHDYEHETGLVGVDPEGSYFPKTVGAKPSGSTLEVDYQVNREPRRFDNAALPQGATTSEAEYGPLAGSLVVESPAPFQARYLTFDFPGWVALVDGEPVPITPGDPDGLITFPVPAGGHTIEVRWEMTPLRRAVTWLSIAALILLIVAVCILARKQEPDSSDEKRQKRAVSDDLLQSGYGYETVHKSDRKHILILLLVAAGFLIFKVVVSDRYETPFYRQAPPQIDNPTDITAAELRLEGYSLDGEPVATGDTFDINLAWRTDDWPAAEYQSNIWLVGRDGLTWSDKETERPRIYEDAPSTIFWGPGSWAWDSREIAVLPGTPPGQYDIVLTFFNLANLQPVTLTGLDDQILGPTTVLGQLNLIPPTQQPDFDMQFTLQNTIGGLNLLGYNQDREYAAPGDPFLLTFFWQNHAETLPQDSKLSLSLVDGASQVHQSWELMPVGENYPPPSWSEGERLRGQHALRLAAGLDSGEYQFFLEDTALGRLVVEAPERILIEPAFDTAVGAIFGELVELVGYTIDTDSTAIESPVTLSLVWQGLREMPVSYRVFVHLIDETGQIQTQSDGEPVVWKRPTTGWSPAEFIIDEHALAIPAGTNISNLALRIGLYNADSGQRLETGENDFLIIPFAQADE